MLEIKIQAIKVISQNQKMQGRAMLRKGTRIELHKLLNNKIAILHAAKKTEFGIADMDEIMRYLMRKMLAMFYKSKKFKDFEDNLKIEILKSIQNRQRPTYKKNINMLISINTYLDIDNPIKGIIDTLCSVGIIENDREIRKLKIIKTPAKRGSVEALLIKIEGDE